MNTQDHDIVANAAGVPHFSMFSNALRAAGLEAAFRVPGPFTVFAPTDEAFRKLPPATLNALLKDRAKLASIINFHATRGEMHARDLESNDLQSIQGEALTIVSGDAGFTVNGAKGSKAEIEASNGVIIPIDTVMMPAA